MRHIKRRDMAVVAATSICLAVIGLGIYICQNYTIVKASGTPDSNTAVAKQDGPTNPQSSSRPNKRYRSAQQPKRFSDHVEAVRPQSTQPFVAVAPPVVTSAPVAPKGDNELPTTKPAGAIRNEPSTETWQPSPQPEIWSGSARNTPSTSYEQPQPETRERGMTRKEKIVIGSAIGGGILTSILIARRHR